MNKIGFKIRKNISMVAILLFLIVNISITISMAADVNNVVPTILPSNHLKMYVNPIESIEIIEKSGPLSLVDYIPVIITVWDNKGPVKGVNISIQFEENGKDNGDVITFPTEYYKTDKNGMVTTNFIIQHYFNNKIQWRVDIFETISSEYNGSYQLYQNQMSHNVSNGRGGVWSIIQNIWCPNGSCLPK
jgi:hypothetical protein